jgi:hypothetical protein
MKVAVVTAIVGNYEATCKPVAEQSIPADFYVYTNNPNITTHGIWKIIDIEPYRFGLNDSDRDRTFKNSLFNNNHSFNRAKFVKLNLHRLPELKDYDIVIWLDGTIVIRNTDFIKYCIAKIQAGKNVLVFDHHSDRNGILKREVIASHFERYTSNFWFDQVQPYQDIDAQYVDYITKGFEEAYFDRLGFKTSDHYGLWVTCFIAFDMKKSETHAFLDKWWYHNMKYTTQDQISFPYICWENNLKPYSLPNYSDNGIIVGNSDSNNLFIKVNHGK